MEKVEDAFGPVIIDFAHNGISAETLYKTVKETYKDKRIVSVFGCPARGGDIRKKDMGTYAGMYADYIYLTADDPDNESVRKICEDIARYIKPYNKPYEIIEDRKSAIETALARRKENDILLILGKGNEDTQLTKNGYEPYEQDINVVKNYIKE